MIYAYITICIAILFGVEQYWVDSYFLKILIKAALFVVIPIFIYKDRNKFMSFIKAKHTDKKRFKISLALGAGVAALILSVYNLLSSHIDTQSIITNLEATAGITAANFWVIAISLLFINSFVEEFFFRGLLIQKNISTYTSAAIFALYHVIILGSWFEWYIFLIVFAGLFAGGLLFTWLNAKGKSLYNGWIMHMGADLAIVLIGLQLFYFA